MGEPDAKTVVTRVFAILGLIVMLAVPLPFARDREATVDTTVVHDSGDVLMRFSYTNHPYLELARDQPAQYLWVLATVTAIGVAISDSIANRAARRDKRRVHATGAALRVAALVLVGAAAIAVGYLTLPATVDGSIGLHGATLAIAVSVGAAASEWTAVKDGKRGWELPTS